MSKKENFVHPYIPNSASANKEAMMKEIGIKDIEELYEDIPEELRFKRELNLPEPCLSEADLKRHVEKILAKNKTTTENISFLGGGCYNHYIPALCDEIVGRSEFLTAYAGEPYEDHGRFQALFEYESLMAELLDFDVVNVPTYDWVQAAATSMRMAGRITERDEILVSEVVSPDRLSGIISYVEPVMKVTLVKHNQETGLLDLDDLKAKMTDKIAGVYFENPSYLGIIESQGQKISDIAHAQGGISIAGVDPISLGLLKPPAQYGVDIACGEIQGLGIHQYYGGATGGFIATRDEEKFVMEYPSRLFGICKTNTEGEWGFDDVAYDRTSFGVREKGKEFIGTAAALWGIGAAVYMSLMGPKGMQELNQQILQKSQYAMKRISEIDGVEIKFNTSYFKEFVVDFSKTGKSIEQINKALLNKNIFGGKDLSKEFSFTNNCALYAVTELITKDDIETLVESLKNITVS